MSSAKLSLIVCPYCEAAYLVVVVAFMPGCLTVARFMKCPKCRYQEAVNGGDAKTKGEK